ncbi:hypothetical protein VP01_2614g1 [Puccinia sorghi]|uniref:Uncharacterized protein n=1 Tax=Puccinia sorghi TaxID=27349 RepID=A0A0L6V4K6_9BASI|nr:hypothetical protein VP01_2614g1 [Puccinia sorghi]
MQSHSDLKFQWLPLWWPTIHSFICIILLFSPLCLRSQLAKALLVLMNNTMIMMRQIVLWYLFFTFKTPLWFWLTTMANAVNEIFVQKHNLKFCQHQHPIQCVGFDGREGVGGLVTQDWVGYIHLSSTDATAILFPCSFYHSAQLCYCRGSQILGKGRGWVGVQTDYQHESFRPSFEVSTGLVDHTGKFWQCQQSYCDKCRNKRLKPGPTQKKNLFKPFESTICVQKIVPWALCGSALSKMYTWVIHLRTGSRFFGGITHMTNKLITQIPDEGVRGADTFFFQKEIDGRPKRGGGGGIESQKGSRMSAVYKETQDSGDQDEERVNDVLIRVKIVFVGGACTFCTQPTVLVTQSSLVAIVFRGP